MRLEDKVGLSGDPPLSGVGMLEKCIPRLVLGGLGLIPGFGIGLRQHLGREHAKQGKHQ